MPLKFLDTSNLGSRYIYLCTSTYRVIHLGAIDGSTDVGLTFQLRDLFTVLGVMKEWLVHRHAAGATSNEKWTTLVVTQTHFTCYII